MEAIVVLFLVLSVWSIGWVIDWAMVKFIIIPAVFAIWGKSLPFWPVMGLVIVISVIFGGGVRAVTKNN